ncbi:MAG: type II secretion system F family protein [Candidatus Omnitrophica bacterium]|nr:type II secretion system F family protein [Candidatus Omnitrophota bacterium]
MILLVSTASFFFIFFLALSLSNILQAEENERKAKIADRLKNSGLEITALRLEKKERLSDLSFLNALLRRIGHLKGLQNYISQAGLSISVGAFILFSLLLASMTFFVGALIKIGLTSTVASSLLIFLFPFLYLGFRRKSRIKKFSIRFPDAIGLIVSSLRAGHSIQMAIESVVQEGGNVVSIEFDKMLSEVQVGQNFEEALKGILNRVDTPELRLFISAVVLQRETGGNLAELLDNLETVIRDRQELKRELTATTAQARFSGLVLSLLPAVVTLMIFVIKPDFIFFFVNDPIGIKLLIACVIGQFLGMFTIQRIVHIEL